MSLDTSSSALHLNLPPTSSTQLRPPTLITVHPSVVASILTHHSRRPTEADSSSRVIGTLMGSRSENGQEIDVRACFAVPHKEDENQIAVDMPFQQGMVQLLGKTGVKESIVGWYATHPTLNAYSALIQNYFSNETSPFPSIHLTIDTELDPSGKKGLGIKGWVSTQLGLSAKAENCVFLPVPVVVKYAESEKAALNLLTAPAPTPSPALPPLSTLSSSLNQLSELIDQSLAYVQSVNAGTTPADPEVGRYLLEGLGRWSAAAGSEEDEGGVKKGLQDTLTVSYLSNLVRSQVELAGRLALVQQPAQ